MPLTIKQNGFKFKDSNDDYVGVDVIAETTLTEQIAAVEGEGATQVAAVQAKGTQVINSIPSDYTELTEEVDELKSALTDVADSTLDTNLFIKSNATDNIRIGVNGTEVTNATGYYASDWIPVEPSTKYIKNSPIEDVYHRVAYYSAAKNFITDAVSNDNVSTTPSNAAYARFCGIISEKDSAWFSKATAKDDIARVGVNDLNSTTEFVSFSPVLRNGSLANPGNEDQVCLSQIVSYADSDSITILIKKPVSAAGNYWRVILETYTVSSGKPESNQSNRVTNSFAVDNTQLVIYSGMYDYPSVGFCFSLAEKTGQGGTVSHRIGDFSTGDVEIIRDYAYQKDRGRYEYTGQKITIGKNKLDCPRYMILTKPNDITSEAQGIAVYGDTLFEMYNLGYWATYDLASQSGMALKKGRLDGATAALHSNSASFGEKYNSNDPYPLLYTTGGARGVLNPSGQNTNGYCVVHRFIDDGESLTTELIQTIYIDQSNFEANGFHTYYPYPNFVVENGFLYTFSAIYRTDGSQEAHDDENRYIVQKFIVPSTSESEVTLTATDICAEYVFNYDVFYMQGATIHNDILYHNFGSGGTVGEASTKPRKNALRAYSMISGTEIAKIDGSLLPYSTLEPEGLAVYDGKLLVSTNTGYLFAIDFH